MVNASAAIGILGGGGGGSVPSVSSLAVFKQIRKNELKFREQFQNRADVQKEIEDFKKAAAKVETVDDLVKDRKVLGVLLSAFGLESELNNPGKLKAIINSDPTDVNSFANQLNDPRFGQLAEFLDIPNKDFLNLVTASKQQEVIDKFLTNEFEKDVGLQNPAVRDAFFFLREVNTLNSTFDVLSNLPLRTIVTSTLRLPPEIARQSVDKQAALIEAGFDIDKAKFGGVTSETSKTRQELLTEDLALLETATSQVTKAEEAVSAIQQQLEDLRTSLEDLPNVTDVAGVNAAEIPVQQAALPDLIRQSGLVASANDAITEADPLITELDGLFEQIRAAEDQDTLDALISQFTTQADKILGNNGLINTATYTDPNTGDTENLFRPSGDGGLGITAIAGGKISTAVDTDGTAVVTTGFDLSTFLTNLQSARDQIASTTLATVSADTAAAEASFDTAQTDFNSAKVQNGVNVSSFSGTVAGVNFAHSLDTQQLAGGISAVDDGLSRAADVKTLLAEIRQLALDAVEVGADLTEINDSYAIKVSALTQAINNPGSVTDGTSTITFDNLLTGGTLDTSILAGLPASITVGNASTLKDDIDNTYDPAVDTVLNDLGRQRTTFEFVANIADPQGALDAQIRKLATDLDSLIDAATVEEKNLIQPFASDLRLALGSVGTVLTVSAQTGFKDSFEDALSSFSYTVLNGGSIAERTSLLNDALFAAGSTASRLKGERFALNIQTQIISQEKGEDSASSTFLKPLENTKFAVQFIEQYLLQKDLEAQGGSLGPVNTDAALVSLVQQIAPASGINLNLLS